MRNYDLEASGSSIKGAITCGSEEGYDGGRKFGLAQALGFLDEVNEELSTEGFSPIPCILTEGTLVGRSDSGLYRETVYTLSFSWSPRVPAPDRETFRNTLMEYADRIGSRMGQVRMYVEFEGETSVLKKT
jgi:hypothetical protein